MNSSAEFQPNQILYLQHQATRLYAEVIQIVPERKMGWVRPLAMVELPNEEDWHSAPLQFDDAMGRLLLHDLQQGADLLCPLSLFQMALDTEVVPILMALETFKHQTAVAQATLEPSQTAHRQLQEFIHRLWQAYPQAFQP
ncbi:hypothetical protein IFO70_11175 [Phormidium tenue FACHB-886]|nr:hypothetical protein [Phormidium tenue FACHB-886]